MKPHDLGLGPFTVLLADAVAAPLESEPLRLLS
jgi:hypothetical protein